MFVVANRFRVAEEYGDQFVERFENRRGTIEDQPGFVRFDLLAPADSDTETHVALTYWESREDFEAWTDSEAFEEAHAGDAPSGMFEDHPNLERHEVALSVTPD
ncbi:MAG: antibiotic biosynthesis monooxygenase [Halodesulfurarchaeum sp.]